jgi:hypothetical protein
MDEPEPFLSVPAKRYVELMGELAAHRLMLASLLTSQSVLIGELGKVDPAQHAEEVIKHAMLGVAEADHQAVPGDRVAALLAEGAHLELNKLRESVRIMLASPKES